MTITFNAKTIEDRFAEERFAERYKNEKQLERLMDAWFVVLQELRKKEGSRFRMGRVLSDVRDVDLAKAKAGWDMLEERDREQAAYKVYKVAREQAEVDKALRGESRADTPSVSP